MARRDATGPSAGVSSIMATCLRSGIAFTTNISTPQPPPRHPGELFSFFDVFRLSLMARSILEGRAGSTALGQ